MKSKLKKPKYTKSQFELYMCESIDNIEKKSIIICIHKDLSKKDIDILSLYGKLVFLEESHQNIDPSNISSELLIS